MTRLLDGAEAREVLGQAGVAFAPWAIATDRDAATAAAARIGGIVAVKSAASDIVHKSDLRCVELRLDGARAVGDAYNRVTARAAADGSATPERVMIEQMVDGIAELVIGVKRDETFGPMLMLGLGGMWVEVMRDTALRLCPVTPAEALGMLSELRGMPLLTGGRGRAKADLDALAEMAAAVSRFAMETPGLIELDLNPVMALSDGAVAVDARIVMEDERWMAD